jgi:hypothetical protein
MIHLILGAVAGGLVLGAFTVGMALVLGPTKKRRRH